MTEKKEELSAYLTESHRGELKDKAVRQNVKKSDWSNLQILRLVAIGKQFREADFSNSTFDSCYLPRCSFDSCDFTGAKFTATNLHAATFTGCKFEYATFERTLIDDEILRTNCPAHENQKLRFARSLRTNYQQIGDAEAANHAIRVELDATKIHLYKAWRSNDRYYRKKYPGLLNRSKWFASWFKFRLLDWIWGNGESPGSLLLTVILLMGAIAILDVAKNPSQMTADSLTDAIWRAPQIFFGVSAPGYISPLWLTSITVSRLVALGFFMSILIKRFNRR